ncbi:MAG: pilus assembly protein [Rubripirellula sp.]|nr:pilus assembly protein [Rubripirellula sp.]
MAAVEFAVCLPLIILLVFGTVEASSFIFLKQTLNIAAYEGIRESIKTGSDNTEGAERAKNILRSRDIKSYEIVFPNGQTGRSKRGEEVVIEVRASTAANSPLAGGFINDRLLVARVVMVKE